MIKLYIIFCIFIIIPIILYWIFETKRWVKLYKSSKDISDTLQEMSNNQLNMEEYKNNMKDSTIKAIQTIVINNEVFDAIEILADYMGKMYNKIVDDRDNKQACIRAINKINAAKYKDEAIDALCEDESGVK